MARSARNALLPETLAACSSALFFSLWNWMLSIPFSQLFFTQAWLLHLFKAVRRCKTQRRIALLFGSIWQMIGVHESTAALITWVGIRTMVMRFDELSLASSLFIGAVANRRPLTIHKPKFYKQLYYQPDDADTTKPIVIFFLIRSLYTIWLPWISESNHPNIYHGRVALGCDHLWGSDFALGPWFANSIPDIPSLSSTYSICSDFAVYNIQTWWNLGSNFVAVVYLVDCVLGM